jgi:hypothetical protein
VHRVDVCGFSLDFSRENVIVEMAGFTRASIPVRLPISTSSIVPLITPQLGSLEFACAVAGDHERSQNR